MPIEKSNPFIALTIMRGAGDEIMILKSKEQGPLKFKYSFTTNFSSFATCNEWEKLVHSERAESFFWPILNGAKRFFRTQKNFFSNKNAMKVQQKRPKTQERRAFENLSAHFAF
jgi:hypothetical protein